MLAHLFLLIPARAGSTAMWDILRRCKDVQSMELDEGQKYFSDDYPIFNSPFAPIDMKHGFSPRMPWYYSNPDNYPWDLIKKIWDKAWDKGKSGIYLEKSPPNCFRWKMLNDNFENSYFIAMIRNPYDQVKAWMRHFNSKNNKNSWIDFAQDWLTVAESLYKAIQSLPRIVWFTYESSFVEKTKKILSLLPLKDISFDLWVNKNEVISKFTVQEIDFMNSITRILLPKLSLVKFFGYPLFGFGDEFKDYNNIGETQYGWLDEPFISWSNAPDWAVQLKLAKPRYINIYHI